MQWQAVEFSYEIVRVQVCTQQGRFAIDAGRVTEAAVAAEVPEVDVIVPAAWDDLRLRFIVV